MTPRSAALGKYLAFPLILALSVLVLGHRNYTPGTQLTGWDNFQIEDNLALNLRRSLFAVWQEFQGVGVVGGLAHGVDLVRIPVMGGLSLLLPHSLLRYIFVFLCLLLGPLGIYFLVKNLLQSHSNAFSGCLGGFLAALFYIFNLATLQNFYVPTEMFTVQYAVYPWLFLVALRYLEKSDRRSALWLVLVNVLAIPMAYAPALFIVYLLLLSTFLLNHLVVAKFNQSAWKKAGFVLASILVINAYWILPFAYFTATKSDEVIAAKNNAVFSEQAFLSNKKYGGWRDVLLLKGFWFDYADLDVPGTYQNLLGGWVDHLQRPVVLAAGYGLAGVVILGLGYALLKLPQWRVALALSFFGSYFALANENPPLGFIFTFLRDRSALFREGFRLVFTKWSLAGAFSYAVLLGMGVVALFEIGARLAKGSKAVKVGVYSGVPLILTVLMGIFIYPFFSGGLIYHKMRVQVPEEYSELKAFFAGQNPATRIANFPQHTFTNWKYYDWGYRGSGWLWYGIEQPILDRAFDPWSEKNEAYYREMSYAIYSGNQELFESLLDKYQVNWLLLDKHMMGTEDPEQVYYEQLEELFARSDKVALVQRFSPQLAVYRTNLSYQTQDFVYAPSEYAAIGSSYRWAYQDQAYREGGVYYQVRGEGRTSLRSDLPNRARSDLSPTSLYAFPSFLGERERANEWIQAGSDGGYRVTLPNSEFFEGEAYAEAEGVVLVEVTAQVAGGWTMVSLDYILPFEAKQSFSVALPGVGDYVSVGGVVVEVGSEVERSKSRVWLGVEEPVELALYSLSPVRVVQKKANLASFSSEAGNWAPPVPNQKYGVEVGEDSLSLVGRWSTSVVFAPLLALLPASPTFEGAALLRIKFDFDSSSGASPRYCLFDRVEEQCLNEQATQELVAVSSEGLDRLIFHFVLDASSSDEDEEISYRDLGLALLPPVAKVAWVAPGTAEVPRLSEEIAISEEYAQPETVLVAKQALESGTRSGRRIVADPDRAGLVAVVGEDVLRTGVVEYLAEDGEGSFEAVAFSGLEHRFGYLLAIASRNLEGSPIRFCWDNYLSKQCDIYTDLGASSAWHWDYYVVPPRDPLGQGRTLHLDNRSTGSERVVNQVAKVVVYRFPYAWLKSLKSGERKPAQSSLRMVSVKKYNPAFYKVAVEGSGLLVLNQAYEKGWVAWRGSKLVGEHVLANNWANGWLIESGSETIFLVFLPQLLQFAGFMVLIAFIIFITTRPISPIRPYL